MIMNFMHDIRQQGAKQEPGPVHKTSEETFRVFQGQFLAIKDFVKLIYFWNKNQTKELQRSPRAQHLEIFCISFPSSLNICLRLCWLASFSLICFNFYINIKVTSFTTDGRRTFLTFFLREWNSNFMQSRRSSTFVRGQIKLSLVWEWNQSLISYRNESEIFHFWRHSWWRKVVKRVSLFVISWINSKENENVRVHLLCESFFRCVLFRFKWSHRPLPWLRRLQNLLEKTVGTRIELTIILKLIWFLTILGVMCPLPPRSKSG